MTKDKDFYTSEGIVQRIRELRSMAQILLDEEARLLTLKECADHYRVPVDATGRPFNKPKSKDKVVIPVFGSEAIKTAVESGYHVVLPAYQSSLTTTDKGV